MQFKLTVQANPGSSQQRLEWRKDHLKVNLKSPPVDGQANEELLSALGELFGLENGNVELVSGETSSRKIILLKGLSREKLTRILTRL